MTEHTFTFSLAEHKESLPSYYANDMEDVELKVTYSKWVQKGVRQIMVNKVERDGVDLHPVLMAFRADKFFQRLAEENADFEAEQKIYSNYPGLYQHTEADAMERYEAQV
jgi:hypothetical protein